MSDDEVSLCDPRDPNKAGSPWWWVSVSKQTQSNLIYQITCKSPASIYEKLRRRDLPFTEESIVKNLDDVAGIRVICPFISDIYTIANLITSQDDITVLKIKDYIKAPKPNGYRSYHMIVEIPVSLQRESSNARRNPDPHDRNGFLGKCRSSTSLQKNNRCWQRYRAIEAELWNVHKP